MAFLAAVGAGISAGGSIQQGNAAEAAGNYNARLNDQNARLSQARTQSDVAAMRREQNKLLGSIRAAYGATGVTMDGSPTDVLTDNLIASELDILNRKYSGELEAMGFRQTAKLDRMGGNAAGAAGAASAGATILGAASNYSRSRPGNPVRVNRAPQTNYRSQIW